MIRHLAIAIAISLSLSACGGDNPDSPTPPATRVLRVDGTLNFGDVQVGQTAEQVVRFFNDGNASLTVSALQWTGGGTYTTSWTNGAIAAGASQTVTVRFTPAAAQSYNGLLTISADNTGGTNQLTVVARGILPPS